MSVRTAWSLGVGRKGINQTKHTILPSSFPLFIYFQNLKALRTPHYSQGSFFILFSQQESSWSQQVRGRAMSCWRQKAFPEVITEIRGALVMEWRGQGAEELGAEHRAWASRGHGGEIHLSPWNVLSLSAVQSICGIASHREDWMPVETPVWDVLAVFQCGILCVLQPASKENPTSKRPLVLSVGNDSELKMFLFNFSQGFCSTLPRGKGI